MLSTPEFLEALRRFSLLEPTKLDELLRNLQDRTIEPRALAQTLIEQGRLTSYQVDQLFAGRGQDLVFGPYVVVDFLGQGGMGAVLKARHRKLGRIDAVKVVRNDRLQTPAAVERFERETRAAAQLRHPHVVLVYDAGEIDGTHYLAMELVAGPDLSRLVDQRGPLPIALACEYVRQAALGLQHVHERGLVHRDIKPSNLLLEQDGPAEGGGVIKLVDLGLARFEAGVDRSSAGRLTESGAVMGTPDFLAPEQAVDAHNVDIRADLYSLGCTLYFLLTARVPFPGGVFTQKLVGHQLHEPEAVDKLRPEAPREMVAVVRKLMAKKPEDRYQTPAELAGVLDNICKALQPPPATAPQRRHEPRHAEAPTQAGTPEPSAPQQPTPPPAIPLPPTDDFLAPVDAAPSPTTRDQLVRNPPPLPSSVSAADSAHYRRIRLVARLRQLLTCHRRAARLRRIEWPILQGFLLGLSAGAYGGLGLFFMLGESWSARAISWLFGLGLCSALVWLRLWFWRKARAQAEDALAAKIAEFLGEFRQECQTWGGELVLRDPDILQEVVRSLEASR